MSRSEADRRTFLITGAAGFIGSHLAETLVGGGHRVLGLDNLSSGRLGNVRHLDAHPDFELVRADIADTAVLDRLVSEADVILHLAAAVGVELILRDPVGTIETNIMGTEAVLKAGLRYGRRILVASTSEVYGKGSRVPFSEEDDVLLGPTSHRRWSYGASKMVDEFLSLAYVEKYGLDVVIFRLFNTIGPRQTGDYGMVVPRFLEQARRGGPISVYGDGLQSRCFCDVRDVVRAVLSLSQRLDISGEVFNVGSTDEISILDLARKIGDLCGGDIPIRTVPYAEAYGPGFEDMQRRVPDISKIRESLGWTPRHSLDECLDNMVAWFDRSDGR